MHMHVDVHVHAMCMWMCMCIWMYHGWPPTERANVVAAGRLRSAPSNCSSRPSCARSMAPGGGQADVGRLWHRPMAAPCAATWELRG
jgi:hypothetical protein